MISISSCIHVLTLNTMPLPAERRNRTYHKINICGVMVARFYKLCSNTANGYNQILRARNDTKKHGILSAAASGHIMQHGGRSPPADPLLDFRSVLASRKLNWRYPWVICLKRTGRQLMSEKKIASYDRATPGRLCIRHLPHFLILDGVHVGQETEKAASARKWDRGDHLTLACALPTCLSLPGISVVILLGFRYFCDAIQAAVLFQGSRRDKCHDWAGSGC